MHAYELVLWLTMPVFSTAVGALVLVLVRACVLGLQFSGKASIAS